MIRCVLTEAVITFLDVALAKFAPRHAYWYSTSVTSETIRSDEMAVEERKKGGTNVISRIRSHGSKIISSFQEVRNAAKERMEYKKVFSIRLLQSMRSITG